MRTAGTILSLDEYLDRRFEPETDLMAGELCPKPLGTDRHSEICAWLCALLMKQVALSRARAERSIRDGNDVVIPLSDPPSLFIEVISPSQRSAEMLAKYERCHEFGVPLCRVVEPFARRAWKYNAGEQSADCAGPLTAGEITVALAELFREPEQAG